MIIDCVGKVDVTLLLELAELVAAAPEWLLFVQDTARLKRARRIMAPPAVVVQTTLSG